MGPTSGADRARGRGQRWPSALGVLVAAGVLFVAALEPLSRRSTIETHADEPSADPGATPLSPVPHQPSATEPPPASGPPPTEPLQPPVPPAPSEPPDAPTPTPSNTSEAGIAFGMDAGSIDAQQAAGFEPDLATLWIGPWTLEHGWKQPDRLLERMVEEGVTPAVHVYYWGDDISPRCLERGCWSTLHGVYKHQAGWQELIEQTVEHLNRTLDGRRAVILLESEFNKASVARYEPLDEALREKTAFVQRAYPASEVVLALGNWNHAAWSTWDRAAAQADAVGIQAMRASTRDTLSSQLGLFNATREGVEWLQRLFDKPVVLQDISISSYPEPEFLEVQADALARLFEGLDRLEAMGVTTVLYRAWFDNPDKSTRNYFGVAERYWGLVSYPDREPKPAAGVWLEGVQAERASETRPGP